MENASKALIIAGAILLSILLISLGIMIFSQAQDTVDNSGMSEAEVTTFNNKFLKYEGTRKGSVVKSLMNDVAASNNDENNKAAKRTIIIEGKNIGGSSSKGLVHFGYKDWEVKTYLIKDTKSYEVKISGYKDDGTISDIEITEK